MRNIEMPTPDGAAAAPIIEFRAVNYVVKAEPPRSILEDVSLAVQSGETVILLGKSGAGKTTLLKLINRMLIATGGEVNVQGRSTEKWDVIRLRRGIGYVIQDVGLFPHFTVERNVSLVPSLEKWPKEKRMERYKEVMQLVGLNPEEFAHRLPRQLSGGQRQRVGVARALAADPQILLMDEPFGALDPVTRADLQREFNELVRRLKKTILLVTHDLREALLLGSRIILMEKGRIAADAAAEEFIHLTDPLVQEYVCSLMAGGPGT